MKASKVHVARSGFRGAVSLVGLVHISNYGNQEFRQRAAECFEQTKCVFVLSCLS